MPMPQPGRDFDEAEHPAAPDTHPLLERAAAASPTKWGFDYAWESDSPAQIVALLTANQADFAARYLNDPGGKGIDWAEAQALQAAGIMLCPVWEFSGTDFTGGFSTGASDGRAAAAAMRALGAPAGSLIWFAIDQGTTDYADTSNYLRGAKSGSAEYIAQLYGHNGVCDEAAAAGLGELHWQTYAWSGGQVSSHAALYQYQNGVMVGGISMDRDRTLKPLAGPWAHSGTSPAQQAPAFPYPAADYLGMQSTDLHCHSGFLPADTPHVRTWQQQMAHRGWSVAVNGVYGSQSNQVCRAFQAEKGLAVDGKVGPVTWAASWTAPVT